MKRIACKFFLPVLALALFAISCSQQMALVPPPIHYGSETCADCGMIISDPHYAAAVTWRASDGSEQTADFDDTGCLLNWRRHHAGARILAAWVKNVRTADWLNASSALYVKNQRLNTPMGSGIAAGSSQNDFAALPIRQPMLTWTDLLKLNGPEADVATSASRIGHND